jgi:hypothetical protein
VQNDDVEVPKNIQTQEAAQRANAHFGSGWATAVVRNAAYS